MASERQGAHAWHRAAICSVAAKIGGSGETLRGRVGRREWDRGLREGATTEVRNRRQALERENRELGQALA